MANKDGPKGFRPVWTITGPIHAVKGVLKTTETIAVGDALIESATAGQIGIALSNSTLLLGVSAWAGTSTAATDIMFYPGLPSLIFEGQTSDTYASTIRYETHDIEGTTGIMEVNEDANTESVIYIVGEDPNTDITAANAKVHFLIMRSSFYPVLAGL